MHQQGAQAFGLQCHDFGGFGVQAPSQIRLALGLVHCRMRCGIDDHIRAHAANGLRQCLQIADITAQAISIHIHALAIQRNHLAQRRETALQLPADLAVLAQQQQLHAEASPVYCFCTQSR